ncbi:hypothetical protein [Methylobacterium nodulans]|uniref:Uncharacterized protein n=1 Tax=Methylobacterium nodulans (strain LMG 21967 / CNCM I-2342 / ORS 2060) TaxID=460265 RepID=B8IND7_METNO|nr:hypothetical protein [Methylobacterium nodulans]ACL56463.1 conserved hypothetical protein [Methylobacterium nodulans ORS 2060]
MSTNREFIESLKHEHARMGRLLQVIDDGCWWTEENPGRSTVEALKEQAAQIRVAVDKIEAAIGHLGS